MDCKWTASPFLCSHAKSSHTYLRASGFNRVQAPSIRSLPPLQKSPLSPLRNLPGKRCFLESPLLVSFLHYQSPSERSYFHRSIQRNLPEQEHSHFLKSLAKKLAVLVVGSLLIAGRFSCRPVLALPSVLNDRSHAAFEGMSDSKSWEDEDEELHLKLLEKRPRDVEALKAVLYGKMKRGKINEAVRYAERLSDIEPGEIEWRLLQALSYELMGNLTKAKRLFKEILKERPLSLRALHGLALVMHKNHEGPAVFEMLNKALELAQSEKRINEERSIKILIAQMHVVKGELEEALKKFQELVNEDPRDFRPYLCQGIIYSLLDRKKEADEQFENYRSLVPGEFPQRRFLDDVMIAAKTESQEQLQKNFDSEFSSRR